MLSAKLLWRHWNNGEVRVLSLALVLAVIVVTAINGFAERLERSLIKNSHSFLAADRLIKSTTPLPDEWSDQAQLAGLEQATTVTAPSVAYGNTGNALVSVKAVSSGYPLVGELLTSNKPYSSDRIHWQSSKGPPAGDAWVDARILSLVGIALNDQLTIGDLDLTVTRVITQEPDRGAGFSLFSPRVMISAEDLQATGIIQPGSRVAYRWLLSGAESSLDQVIDNLSPALSEHQRLQSIDNAQLGLKRNLEKAQSFMRLAAMMGVLLAGIAIAINAQVFARRHTESIALMKSLGLSARNIRKLYSAQLLLLGVLASTLGLLIGAAIEQVIVSIIKGALEIELVGIGPLPYILSLLTGMACLIGFALPSLWHLPAIPPIRVLRQDVSVNALSSTLTIGLGLATLLGLAFIYSRSITSTAIFALALCLLIIVGTVLSKAFWLILEKTAVGVNFRLAIANINRHFTRSVTQVVIFSGISLLLLVMIAVRTLLIDQWQLSLPKDAPNHFMMNISQTDAPKVKQKLIDSGLDVQPFYPVVRARLTTINNQAPTEQQQAQVEVLAREANLSESITVPESNQLLTGEWWQADAGRQVSVESDVAKELGLSIGDTLGFSVGGLSFDAVVTSTREVNWDSLTPNFYFLFSPKALQEYTPLYLTSLYVENKPAFYDILREYPTIAVVDTDLIITTVRNIIDKVSIAVEFMLWIILAGGAVVMVSALNASMVERWQAASIMRTVGASRRQLFASLGAEFAIIGLTAGVLAAAGAFLVVALLQSQVFTMAIGGSYWLYLGWPLLLTLVITGFGLWLCRRVVLVSPMNVLRNV